MKRGTIDSDSIDEEQPRNANLMLLKRGFMQGRKGT